MAYIRWAFLCIMVSLVSVLLLDFILLWILDMGDWAIFLMLLSKVLSSFDHVIPFSGNGSVVGNV